MPNPHLRLQECGNCDIQEITVDIRRIVRYPGLICYYCFLAYYCSDDAMDDKQRKLGDVWHRLLTNRQKKDSSER